MTVVVASNTMPRARPWRRTRTESRRTWRTKPAVLVMALTTLVAVLAPLLAPHDPLVPAAPPFSAPGTSGAWLGTDQVGRDVLSRVLFGLRTSWLAAIAVVAISAAVGSVVGVIAGLQGRRIDSTLMRITELFLAMPAMIVVIAVVAALGPSLSNTLLALSIVSWPYYARIVRGEVRALAARPHLDAARLAGESKLRLATRHLLPGAVPVIIVAVSLDLGATVIALGSLSFLGLGAQAPAPELGAMAAQGMTYVLESWWIPVIPALGIFVAAIVANLGGDAIRDLLEDR